MRPVARDMHALTARATSGPSLARCLDGLDALTLQVLAAAESLAHAGPMTDTGIVAGAVATLPGAEGDPEAVSACGLSVAHCIDIALLWGTSDDRRVVQGVGELLRPLTIAPWPRPMDAQAGPRHEIAIDLDAVDARAGLHALELVTAVRDILDDWSMQPPAILRTGGLALRDLAAAGRLLHRGFGDTATILEIAHAAGLVVDDQDAPAHWVPTDAYDLWQALPRPDQWLVLVHSWLGLPRLPSLADERTQILVDTRDRRVIPAIRRAALEAWAATGVGQGVAVENLEAILDFAEPRRAGELRHLTIESTVREAEVLGLASGGVLSTTAMTLLDDSLDAGKADAHARQVLAPTLPHEIDHVMIQADHTIIAPGPLDSQVARQLRVVAEVESRGHATVYRVTDESLTRAFESGWDADAIEELLTQTSTTPVPQPLSYLIHDAARRHGAVRVGNALGYVRCDNVETLATALHDKRLARLSLSRLADTVLISPYPATDLITALRAAGYAPAAEGSDGRMLIHRPSDRRVRTPKAAPVQTEATDAMADAALRALRAGSTSADAPTSGSAPGLSATAVASTIKKAVLEHAPLWLGYAEIDGTVTEQLVDPIRISAGTLTAYDHRSDVVRAFAIARVTGVARTPSAPA